MNSDVASIVRSAKKAKGRKEYLDYLETRTKLSPKQAILANCFQCTGYYTDGRRDCEVEDCPFYPYMPYRKCLKREKRVMSEKQAEAFERMAGFRSGARSFARKKTQSEVE